MKPSAAGRAMLCDAIKASDVSICYQASGGVPEAGTLNVAVCPSGITHFAGRDVMVRGRGLMMNIRINKDMGSKYDAE